LPVNFWLLNPTLSSWKVLQIAILAVCLGLVLRFLRRPAGSGLIRGLGLIASGLLLISIVVVFFFDFPGLIQVVNYLHTSVLVGLLVIFQPELRRGLILLGRYRKECRSVSNCQSLADILANAAELLSRQHIGALIAIRRAMTLESYIETGEPINGELTQALVRTIFSPNTPLHDGALIIERGRIAAAACQLPLGLAPDQHPSNLGMRHRAAICLSEETDAVVVVVSEETGTISLAVGGFLEPVAVEHLSQRLVALLGNPTNADLRRMAA
jgi:diadenylate cyclase